MRPRRLIVAAIAAGALLVGLAAVFWFVFVPNWRPPLADGERYGVDVSAHQGEIEWEQVAEDGIQFAYTKATEGQGWIDERFTANWDGAETAGLDRGAYHFFTLCAAGDEQARNFLRVAPPDDDAMPPVIDLELTGNCAAGHQQTKSRSTSRRSSGWSRRSGAGTCCSTSDRTGRSCTPSVEAGPAALGGPLPATTHR